VTDTFGSLRAEWERDWVPWLRHKDATGSYSRKMTVEFVERLFAALEERDDSLSYLQDMAKREMEAAETIKREEKWPENAWPAPAERSWMLAAQSEIARLKAALEAAERERDDAQTAFDATLNEIGELWSHMRLERDVSMPALWKRWMTQAEWELMSDELDKARAAFAALTAQVAKLREALLALADAERESSALYKTGAAEQSALIRYGAMRGPHPSHKTRFSDASSFDEICVNCGAHDEVPGGWGRLAEPCPNPDATPVPKCEWERPCGLAKCSRCRRRETYAANKRGEKG